MTLLRALGTVSVSPAAAHALARLGMSAECIAAGHQRGEWGGVAGVRRLLWQVNRERDELGFGGWVSLHKINGSLLWVVTTVTRTAHDRQTTIYLHSERKGV